MCDPELDDEATGGGLPGPAVGGVRAARDEDALTPVEALHAIRAIPTRTTNRPDDYDRGLDDGVNGVLAKVDAILARVALALPEQDGAAFVDVVFDGPPSHESGRFIECEGPDGSSVNAGEVPLAAARSGTAGDPS